MCVVGVRIMLLLPLVARCIETIYVCIWRMFVYVCCSDCVVVCVVVCVNVCCVSAVVEDNLSFSIVV